MPCITPDLTVIHRDPAFLAVEKPGGLLAVPGRGPDKQDCVVARLRRLFPQMIAQPAVHRLDMYTSGLMVVAVTREAHRHLCRQFELHRVGKRYIALLEGIVSEEEGDIRLPFRLDPANRPDQVHDPLHEQWGPPGGGAWRWRTGGPGSSSPR